MIPCLTALSCGNLESDCYCNARFGLSGGFLALREEGGLDSLEWRGGGHATVNVLCLCEVLRGGESPALSPHLSPLQHWETKEALSAGPHLPVSR